MLRSPNEFRALMSALLIGLSVFTGSAFAGRADAQAHQVAKLERENRRLRRDLSRATLVIDVQKKVSELLGITLAAVTDDPESR